MAAIDALVRQGVRGELRDETQIVYVSPLKALSNDIQRNLEAPLKGIRATLGWFNRSFGRAREGYVSFSRRLIHKSLISFLALGCFALGAFLIGRNLPSSFLPDEDQGYVYVLLQLPDASSLQRTSEIARKVEDIMKNTPGVRTYTSIIGFNLLSTVYNTYSGFFFVNFKPWSERTRPEESYAAIKAHLNTELAKLPEGRAFSFSPPSIPGVGTAGGVTLVLEDRAGRDIAFLSDNVNKFIAAAAKRKEILNLTTTFLPRVPQVFVDVDRDKVMKQGVALADVYRTLQCYMGGIFVNYFNRFGRQWQVYVEAEGEYRDRADKLGSYFVRNRDGVDGAAFRADDRGEPPGPGIHDALQPLPLREDQCDGGFGLQLQPGDRRPGGGVRADARPSALPEAASLSNQIHDCRRRCVCRRGCTPRW